MHRAALRPVVFRRRSRWEVGRSLSSPSMAEASGKTTFEWTKAATLAFIELLKQHPCWWRVKSREYKMKNLRSASLETMRAELSDHLKCEMHKQDIMKKIHTLITVHLLLVFLSFGGRPVKYT